MKKLTLKNLVKAVQSPGKALKYLKLNQASKGYDSQLVAGYFKDEKVYQAYKEEIMSSGLIAELEQKLQDFSSKLNGELRGIALGTGAMNIYQGIKLYTIIRHLKPEKVVETGVCNGASTSYILKALQKNGKGTLYSIDFPDVLDKENEEIWEGKGSSIIPEDGATGWLVPKELRDRWELRLGKSQDLLPPLLEELGSIDFFVHDSEHSYECMTFEFETSYPVIREGGILASHDIDDNTSFQDFCKKNERSWMLIDDYMGFFVK
ncbi:MAG: class I SAM-dependent methyltransferase [Bacteroidota bacterium]